MYLRSTTGDPVFQLRKELSGRLDLVLRLCLHLTVTLNFQSLKLQQSDVFQPCSWARGGQAAPSLGTDL